MLAADLLSGCGMRYFEIARSCTRVSSQSFPVLFLHVAILNEKMFQIHHKTCFKVYVTKKGFMCNVSTELVQSVAMEPMPKCYRAKDGL